MTETEIIKIIHVQLELFIISWLKIHYTKYFIDEITIHEILHECKWDNQILYGWTFQNITRQINLVGI